MRNLQLALAKMCLNNAQQIRAVKGAIMDALLLPANCNVVKALLSEVAVISLAVAAY